VKTETKFHPDVVRQVRYNHIVSIELRALYGRIAPRVTMAVASPSEFSRRETAWPITPGSLMLDCA
jgi:hypothetical protein